MINTATENLRKLNIPVTCRSNFRGVYAPYWIHFVLNAYLCYIFHFQ